MCTLLYMFLRILLRKEFLCMDILRILIIIGVLAFCWEWVLEFLGMVLIAIARLFGR